MSAADRIDPAFGNWLAGFVDGEGCFYIGRITMKKKGVQYVNYRCAFALALRDDDRAIIEEIRDCLGVGRIGTLAPRKWGTRPMVDLRIEDKAGARLLVDVFDRFPLRAKKARDYVIWREATIDWCSRGRGGREGQLGAVRHDWALMARLHQELIDVRKYAQ